jgi:hypothetical protein
MKQVKVKQSVRKGKLVRGYNRVLTKVTDKLFKRDKDGKKKLTNLSKGLIGATSIAGLLTAFKYRRNIAQLSEKIVNKVSPTVKTIVNKTAKTISQPITNTTGDIMAASVTGGAMTRDARRKYIRELDNLPSEAVNITPFTKREDSLITRRIKRNDATLNKRVNNARGKLTSVNYNSDNDLYLAIKTNKDFSYKGASNIEDRRATRKALAKKLKQQLGVNPGTPNPATPVKRKRGRPRKDRSNQ